MHDTSQASFLREGFILLGFALAFVLAFRRAGLGATLGYLVAGAVVGPQVLGLVGDAEARSASPSWASPSSCSSSGWS